MIVPAQRCQWCHGITGQALSCTCKTQCGASKCPVDPDPLDDWYGYLKIQVPRFEHTGEHSG